MYLLKIKGVNRMPDFIQIRDDQYTLIAYFRADRPMHSKINIRLSIQPEDLETLIRELPYGQLKKI
jgi:hypothetical protein